MTKSNSDHPKPDSGNELLEWIKTLGIALIAAFGIRTFIAQAFHIPSESMLPTLEVGDRLVVFKQSYTFGDPQAGDIIVFKAPPSAVRECGLPPDQTSDFIKRVIGTSGNQVEITGGQVYINGTPSNESYIVAPPNYQVPLVTIPPESLLVLGDNRNNSCDGHAWGFLPENLVVGRAVFRYWPPNRIGPL
jgi:signal peptidase I